jgi:Mg2+/Co2+ transporter CorB
MILKEKIQTIIIDDYGNFQKIILLEKIAEEFAIEFSEWCVKYRDKNKNINGDILHSISKYDETYLTKELLEIFKKEKGL